MSKPPRSVFGDRTWITFCGVLLVLLSDGCRKSQNASSTPGFSRYLPDPLVSNAIAFHEKYTTKQVRRTNTPSESEGMMLVMTTFKRGGNSRASSVSYTLLTKSGLAKSWRYVVENGVQGGGADHEMTTHALEAVKQGITALPQENEYPPLDDLAIISYRSGTSWTTRSCHISKADQLAQAILR